MKPIFQQRHYEALAQIMQDVIPAATNKAETRAEYRERVIRAMCEAFKVDNEHFKEDRFRCACVPGSDLVRGHRRSGPAMPYVQPQR
jgi:hypothetical protein